jgi:hypothetical protein
MAWKYTNEVVNKIGSICISQQFWLVNQNSTLQMAPVMLELTVVSGLCMGSVWLDNVIMEDMVVWLDGNYPCNQGSLWIPHPVTSMCKKVNPSLLLSDFDQNCNVSTNFDSQISNFMKICSAILKLLHEDRWIDMAHFSGILIVNIPRMGGRVILYLQIKKCILIKSNSLILGKYKTCGKCVLRNLHIYRVLIISKAVVPEFVAFASVFLHNL